MDTVYDPFGRSDSVFRTVATARRWPGATALAGLTQDPGSVLVAAAVLALVLVLVYVKTEFAVPGGRCPER